MVSISWPCDPPASASQSSGIIGMSHCAQPGRGFVIPSLCPLSGEFSPFTFDVIDKDYSHQFWFWSLPVFYLIFFGGMFQFFVLVFMYLFSDLRLIYETWKYNPLNWRQHRLHKTMKTTKKLCLLAFLFLFLLYYLSWKVCYLICSSFHLST